MSDLIGEAWTHTGFAQRLHFGAGVVALLPEIVKELGIRRALFVTTGGRAESDDGVRIAKLLGRSLASSYTEVRSHVPTTIVQAAMEQARRDAVDGVVSFGGGSCADLGKAVSYFTEQAAGTPGASYADRPALRHIAIPTTYSGAELTPFFGMTDERSHTKGGGGGPTTAPIAVVYDPLLTLSTPARVSAETGMNALAHCIEVVYSPHRTPEAEAIALAGIRRLATRAARRSSTTRTTSMPRTDALAGAALAGRSLENATMGVHHGLAQLVGGRTGIPHGLANAVILPHAMRFNADVAPDEMQRIGEALGDPDDAPSAVARLVERLGLPTRLRDCDVDEDDLDAVARMSQSSSPVQANLRPVGESDARAILDDAY